MALVTMTMYGRHDEDVAKLARMQEVWTEVAIEQIHESASSAASVAGIEARDGTMFVQVGVTPLPAGYTIDETIDAAEWDAYAATLEATVS